MVLELGVAESSMAATWDRKVHEALPRFARKKPNTLYRFTRVERMQPILSDGILKGDVATGATTTVNAPWLTIDPEFSNQVWAAAVARIQGMDSDPRKSPKTGVRFKVEIPVSHLSSLNHWLTYARENNLDEAWVQAMIRSDGGVNKAVSHWFYDGVIQPEWITETRLRDPYRFRDLGSRGIFKQIKRAQAVVPSGLQIGQDVSISRGVSDRMSKLTDDPMAYSNHLLARHRMADYGNSDPATISLNTKVLRERQGRVVSQYQTPQGNIHVVTLLGPSNLQYTTFFVTPEEVR